MKNSGLRAGGEGGQILILTALSMTAMLAIAALSIDVSFMYDKRNRLYSAADAAAKSGAIEVYRNSSIGSTALQAFANYEVTRQGFSPGTTTTVTVHRGPSSGPFAGNTSFVEVIVSEPTATFFGRVLGWTSMTPGARAVAGTSPGSNCIVALGPGPATSVGGGTTVPVAMNIGNSELTMSSCNVSVNGNLDGDNPGARITGGGTNVSSLCYETCTGFNGLQTGAPPASDPFSTLPAPTVPGACSSVIITGTMTLSAGCYSRIDMDNNATLNFSSGIYKLTGAFTTRGHSTVNGSGVMFYLTTAVSGATVTGSTCDSSSAAGCFNIGNNANWTLSAPTSGTYRAILMYQDSHDQLPALFDGNSPTYNLSGAMYFPKADVSFRNGMNSTNDCTLFVAQSILINNGNGSFSNACSAYGGSPILTVTIVE